jgi:hypothetical protein
MALTQRLRDVVLDSAVRIGDLTVERLYPVLRSESVDTKNGLSFLLTIHEILDYCVKVFLQGLYSLCFSEEDTSAVNEQTVHYSLIYKRLSSTSRSYILQIEIDSWESRMFNKTS